MADLAHLERLGLLFEHPDADFPKRVEELDAFLAERYPLAHLALEGFRRLLPTHDLHAMEELHARTFDVQAITTLDAGYILFGEDYKRGEILANLTREHREAGTDCGSELPDHLPNLLRLLPRLTDEELRQELVVVIVEPALRKMIREFEPERVASKDRLYRKHHKTVLEAPAETRLIYRAALEAVLQVLREDFGLGEEAADERPSVFAQSVGTEMTVEDCDLQSGTDEMRG